MVIISFEYGTQRETLFAGPPAAYTAGGSASTSVFALTAGATGNFQQPVIRGLYFQQGRQNQLVTVEGWLQVSGTTSTTLTTQVLLATTPNQSAGSTLLTFPGMVVSSYTAGSVYFRASALCLGFGYGTSAVATNLSTTGLFQGTGNLLTISGVAGTNTLNVIDGSVNQWVTIVGQFSGNSANNLAQLTRVMMYGEN